MHGFVKKKNCTVKQQTLDEYNNDNKKKLTNCNFNIFLKVQFSGSILGRVGSR
jgi:hypothetical protein